MNPSRPVLPRILVVENESDLFKTIELSLGENFVIIWKNSGESALNAIEEEDFDILLTDFNLGGDFDGCDIVMFAYATNPAIPIIIMSGGDPDKGRIDAARHFTGASFIRKPFTKDQILDEINSKLTKYP
ncbi:MAG: response regulator [Bacteriovoracia bacterium]